jgi:hypothetical protein
MTKISQLSIGLGAISLSVLEAFSPLNIALNQPLSLMINHGAVYADVPYIPPVGGARPQHTEGSGARGCTKSVPVSLNLLAPSDHTASTTLSHPTFLWYIPHTTELPLVFTLASPHARQPIFRKELKADQQAGVMKMELPADNPGLEENKEYRWTVALVCNEQHPSENSFAYAWIKRVKANQEIKQLLSSKADNMKIASAYTHTGIWYDGLALLNQERMNNPQANVNFTSLLNQVGLYLSAF